MYTSNLKIDASTYDHSFCEVELYENKYSPEYCNAITALFISYIGYFGIQTTLRPINNSIFGLYFALIINGISSCFYHITHTIGWGLIDRLSMILIALYCFQIFVSVFQQLQISSTICHILHSMSMLYIVALATVCGLHQEELFNTLFGGFLVSIVLFLIVVYRRTIIPRCIMAYGIKGVILLIISGSSWIATEIHCRKYTILPYLFGHSIWHISVALGGYYITLLPVYILSRKSVDIIQTRQYLPQFIDILSNEE
jgi:hypothetical protein